jgi:hypothetical protein
MWFSLRCVLTEHEYRMVHERGRVFLTCARCRHETPGWRVEAGQTPTPARRVSTVHVALRPFAARVGH